MMRVDESYANGTLVRSLTHNGDGTGILAELIDGQWVETAVSGLAVPDDTPVPTPEERIAQLEADLAATASALDALLATMEGQ